jgi:hypothetical protein
MPTPYSRRDVLSKLVAISVISGTLGCVPQTAEPLREDDVAARSLGYKIDAATVDQGLYPQFRAGQNCLTCRAAIASDAAQLLCSSFSGRTVARGGWCASFEAR